MILTTFLTANASGNLITCQTLSPATWTNCAVIEGNIVETQLWESQAVFSYNFSCSPGWDSMLNIGIQSEDTNQFERFIFGKSGNTSAVIGKGPFKIVDQSKDDTNFSPLDPGCSLTVTLNSLRPSDRTINEWQNKKRDLAELKSKSIIARDGFSALSVYQAGFSLLEEISNNITQDLSNNLDLRKKLEKYSPIRKILEDMVFNTVEIKDFNTGTIKHTVSREDKILINSLLGFVNDLPPLDKCQDISSTGCQHITLDDYLNDEQKKSLTTLVSYKYIIDDAKNHETSFASDVLRYSSQETELCKISKPWITWDVSGIPSGC